MNNSVIMPASSVQVSSVSYDKVDSAPSCGDASTRMPPRMPFRDYILHQCYCCERRMRCYFGLEGEERAVFARTPPESATAVKTTARILTMQLTNLLYDTYIRLLLSGHQRIVVMHPSPVFSCLKQALTKFDQAITASTTADSIDERGEQRRQQIDLCVADMAQRFDDLILLFDRIRKNGSVLSLDLLLPEYIETLVCEIGEAPRIDHDAMLICGVNSGELAVNWLSIFQTLYIPDWDNWLIDHRHHREQVYIPVYRFGDDAVAAMSMSSYIGNTMRRNIRQLYDFIDTLLAERQSHSPVCPCVVIFNMFVRDYFRVYHSKSLPQNSFVQIYDSQQGDSIKISYMLIANRFPKIAQWFNSINNQFVKKTGYARVVHIDGYLRLISRSFEVVSGSSKPRLANKIKKPRRKKTLTKKLTKAREGSRPVTGNDKKKRPGYAARRDLSFKSSVRRDAGVVHALRQTHSKRKEKMTLSRLFDASIADLRPAFCQSQEVDDPHGYRSADHNNGTLILADLYRSGFSACQHRQVVRIYIQKRSHDENASLSKFCHDCHCYV